MVITARLGRTVIIMGYHQTMLKIIIGETLKHCPKLLDHYTSITLNDYYARIALLRDEREGNMDAQKILDRLEEWGEGLHRK